MRAADSIWAPIGVIPITVQLIADGYPCTHGGATPLGRWGRGHGARARFDSYRIDVGSDVFQRSAGCAVRHVSRAIGTWCAAEDRSEAAGACASRDVHDGVRWRLVGTIDRRLRDVRQFVRRRHAGTNSRRGPERQHRCQWQRPHRGTSRIAFGCQLRPRDRQQRRRRLPREHGLLGHMDRAAPLIALSCYTGCARSFSATSAAK